MTGVPTIGSAFWLKRGTFVFHRKPQRLNHFFQHMVPLNVQPAFSYLNRNMPIPQVVTGPGQKKRVSVSYTHLTLPTKA